MWLQNLDSALWAAVFGGGVGVDVCQLRDWTGGISAETLGQSNNNFKNLTFVTYYCVKVLHEHFPCVILISLLFYRWDNEGTERLSNLP